MCVVVFLSCLLFGMGHPELELAGRCLELGLCIEMGVFALRWKSLAELLTLDITWGWGVSCGPMS